MMLEELQRRNYAETTIDSYIRAVEDFSRYFNCSPDRLGPRHVLAPLPVASAPRRVRAHPKLRLLGQSQTCHQLATLFSAARRGCNSADRTRQLGHQQRERSLALPQLWWPDDGRRKIHRC